MEVAELKMLRFSLGVTRMDNESGMSTSEGQRKTQVARLRWFGHVRRK